MPNLPADNPVTKLPPAAAVALSETEQEALLKKIRQKVPAVTFTSISPSELPSWYLLKSTEGTNFYTDKDANYLTMGLIIDINRWVVLDNQLDGTNTPDTFNTTGD